MRKQVVVILIIVMSGCAHVPQSAGLVRIEDLDKPMRSVSRPQMEYIEVWQPPHGSRQRAEAIVSIIILEDGSVADAAVARATNPEIGRAAVEAVKKWRFEPPRSRGIPARVQMMIPFVSDLENTKFVTP